MIAGMCICANTIGANKAYIYLRYEYRNYAKDLEGAIADVKKMNPAFEKIAFETKLGAGPYIAGEESALFESIEGKPCKPRTDRNKFPTQKGLFGMPTVINNAETFTAVPMIMLEGGKKWGSVVGESGEKGIKLYNVLGDVDKSKCIELPVGTSVNTILKESKA
eukprot:131900_1